MFKLNVYEDYILIRIRKRRKFFTVSEISRICDMHFITAKKYLNSLAEKGLVKIDYVGKRKIFKAII